ncbi:ribonuclease H-like domain-containing protein [Morchella snyderi]|nr:ribonuclease H-like domain-containing protein [Morchella snyderi]
MPPPTPAATPTPVPTADTFTHFQDTLFSRVVATVKTAGAIAASDVSFQRSSDPAFNAGLDEVSARILALANQLLRAAARGSPEIAAPARMRDVDDVENGWGGVVEVVDYLLEKADTCLDEYTGAIKQKYPTPLPGAQLTTHNAAPVPRATSWQSRKLPKPQLLFPDPINNFAPPPFKPLLTTKPHALLPLADSLRLEPTTTTHHGTTTTTLQYAHPYHTEITTTDYPAAVYHPAPPLPYPPFATTTATWVATPAALAAMLARLAACPAIAVDLEHHDTRSYIGFTCLIQISSRDHDWIVDALALRGQLHALNEVFADPAIVKVLHGAYMDVRWLQRDFGVYVVGLFDTHYAAKALGFPGLGLAYLLKRYVGFDADKQYQLADWRIRPLTKEMFDYARSDTHFLLHIFDHLRNELIARSDPSNPSEDRLQRVLQDSRETALKRYEREPYDAATGLGAAGWFNMVARDNLTPLQLALFKAVHQWRDNAAREADESTHYTLPRRQLFGIARQAPTDVEALLRVCVPTSHVVRERAAELVELVRRVLASPLDETAAGPTAREAAAAASALEQEAPPAATVPIIKTDIFAPAATAAASIQAHKSAFWGPVAGVSSRWEPGAVAASISLAVELPPLTAAVWVTPGEKEKAREAVVVVDPGARAEHQYVKGAAAQNKKKGDDIIVVKSLGGARKRKIPDDDDDDEEAAAPTTVAAEAEAPAAVEELKGGSASDEEREEGEEDAVALEPARKKSKREKKELRREKRRLAAAAAGASAAGDSGSGDAEKPREIQAFDYSKAPPVFNGHKDKDTKGKGRDKKPQQQRFDPYSKSGDAPRGMSRGQKERAGKSHTFKQ